MTPNSNQTGSWGRVSAILGWASTGCWFVGWYPQLLTNFHARSVAGFSLDNILLNFLGFACYSCYNGALFYSESARAAYRSARTAASTPMSAPTTSSSPSTRCSARF